MSEIFKIGKVGAPVVIVTDWSPPHAKQKGQLMSDHHLNLLVKHLKKHELSLSDCVMLNPCPINHAWLKGKPPTDKQHKEWMTQFVDDFHDKLMEVVVGSKVILALGKTAASQLMGKPIKVTKARGQFTESPRVSGLPVMVTLSPAHVLSRGEVERDFETDIGMIKQLRDAKWKVGKFAQTKGKYELCLDLSDWIKDPPLMIAGDTETTGLHSFKDASVLCMPLTAEEGHSRVIPFSRALFPDVSRADINHVVGQVRTLAANHRIKWVGHNFKFDQHMLALNRIFFKRWWMDTLQLAFAADENMLSKSLKECVRRWVKPMAGYSDNFDATYNKGNLIEADPADVIEYAGGDTDATFRLCKVLVREVMQDKQQWQTVLRVQMPALRMFFRMERQGMKVNAPRLRRLSGELQHKAFVLETRLMKMIPKAVKQKHFEFGLSFGRREFLSDILFSKEGFNLTPVARTADGKPALDAVHLANFETHNFVTAYTEFQKISKMLSTYVGLESDIEADPVSLLKDGGWPIAIRRMTNKEPESFARSCKLDSITVSTPDGELEDIELLTEWENDKCLGRDQDKQFRLVSKSEPTGFWKHLMPDGKVHPSFFLDRTVTGRSSSRDPNFQNIPKRGKTDEMKAIVKAYRGIFVAHKGNVILECDLSQAELVIATSESMDPTMLKAYRMGLDLHALTASKVAGVSLADVTKDQRQGAKAVNFGFLYTMGVDGFIIYAKTTYGVTFTKRQAEQIKETYFRTYPYLKKWHDRRRMEVRRDGFVRALHGAKRNLPSINSHDRGVQAEAERQAINSPVQRFASDCTLMSMVQFTEGCPDWIWPMGTIHDSGVSEARERSWEKAASWKKWCFMNPPLKQFFGFSLPVPMGADISMGPDLGSTEEMKHIEAVKPPWI